MKPKHQEWHGDVAIWLKSLLDRHLPNWHSDVFVTSRLEQGDFLDGEKLFKAFPMLAAFGTRVDVTAVIRRGDKVRLALADCKAGLVTLKDVGPLLAYSRIVSPALALILSPDGISNALRFLMRSRSLEDSFHYGEGRSIKVGRWDLHRKKVDMRSLVPRNHII